jgi:hypothetical protein
MTEQDENKEIVKEVKEPKKKTSAALTPTPALQHPGFDTQSKCLLCGQFRTNLVGQIFCPEYLIECPRFVEDRL